VIDYGVRSAITIEGRQLERHLERFVEQVVVDDHLLLPDMFTITLLDPARDILTRAGLRIGAKVAISGTRLGAQEDKPLITAEVTAIDGDYDVTGARIQIRGYDVSHRLHRGRLTRTFLNDTDSDIARKIADAAQLEIGAIEPTDKTYEHVSQANMTDWEFLTARAKDIGYEVAVVDGKFYFRQPAESSTAPGEGNLRSTDPRQLVFGRRLLEFRPRLTAAEQVAEVEVRSWDRQSKQAIVGTAQAATVAAETNGGTPAGMAQLFGSQRFVAVDRPLDSNTDADAAAAAKAEQIGSAFAEAEGVARGDPELRAGTSVSIAGVADNFVGRYVLSHTRHVFDRDGYRTHFEISGRHDRSVLGLVSYGAAARGAAGTPGSQKVYGLVVAIVTANDDPEKQGRVKVRFPWLADDYESHWASVAQFGAGPNSGAVFIPEVNDEVLVGFEHGDFSRPYVIGGLYNGVDKPNLGNGLFDRGKVKRRGFVSRRGHRIVFFDDNANSGIALLSADGNLRIALKQSGRELRIYGNPRVVIEGASDVSVRSGGNLSLKAEANLDIEANGQMTIKSAGVLDIDGAIIELN
jgi:uncharacterized protein involved in type VI secretion and phage assembly